MCNSLRQIVVFLATGRNMCGYVQLHHKHLLCAIFSLITLHFAAVASLQTYSTALSSFTSAWRSLYSDATAVDSALASRLEGFSQLELLCSAMDGPGLRAYLTGHRDELRDPSRALDAALLLAPDPGLLVLAAAAGFCRVPLPAQGERDKDDRACCGLLVNLLDRLRALGVKPSPEAREEARAVAADWKRSKRIEEQVVLKKETIAFLLLVGMFGLVADVGSTAEVINLVVSVSSRERAVEVFIGLGLDLDKHMPVLIQTMINKGKQLDAVKFIQALNLAHKYPLLPVLRSYMNDAKNAGNMIRTRGDGSASQNAGDEKERTLLGVLQKFIKENKLEELPILEEADKRLAQLEQQSAERKRALYAVQAAVRKVNKNVAAATAASQSISKNILTTSEMRPQFPGNVVQGSILGVPNQFPVASSQSILGVPSQYQMASSQSVLGVANQYQMASSRSILGVPNQYQVASSQGIVPAITSPLLAGGSQRPADYYGLASTRPSAPNVSTAHASSRSQLYSADPLASLSRASDKKGSSYNYSLSNMSKYNP